MSYPTGVYQHILFFQFVDGAVECPSPCLVIGGVVNELAEGSGIVVLPQEVDGFGVCFGPSFGEWGRMFFRWGKPIYIDTLRVAGDEFAWEEEGSFIHESLLKQKVE
jgi:hypothetical protein